MSRPLVSVIVPAYNRERYLGEALDSIFAQGYHPLEVVVADDGSTDGTARVARAYPDVRLLSLTHRGFTAARNAAIAASTGSLLAFLDSDDLWLPGKLDAQVGILERNPHLGYCYSRHVNFLEPGCVVPAWIESHQIDSVSDYGTVQNQATLSETQSAAVSPEHLGAGQTAAGEVPDVQWQGRYPRPTEIEPGPDYCLAASMVVRREVFDRIGEFDTAFGSGSDTEWMLRAHRSGIPHLTLDEVYLRRRIHDTNLSFQRESYATFIVRLAKRNLDRNRLGGAGADPSRIPPVSASVL